MPIFEALMKKYDSSSTSPHHLFLGNLKDFMETSGNSYSDYEQLFSEMLEIDNDLKICIKLPIDINHKTISNQIIHYKDAFKLPNQSLCLPILIFWKKDDKERAILLTTTNYIESKGLYFCMTEPDGEFDGCRNEILAMYLSPETKQDIVNAFTEMYYDKRAIGAIQRFYDHKYFENVDEMKEQCIELANTIFNDTLDALPDLEDRSERIYETVGRIFLIKKALYVQYMMTKDLLVTRHEGDVRKQRQFAKAYTDEIPIVSYSALWRVKKNEINEEDEERGCNEMK